MLCQGDRELRASYVSFYFFTSYVSYVCGYKHFLKQLNNSRIAMKYD